jgi:hypothetical protein
MEIKMQNLFITHELEDKNGYKWTLASRFGEVLSLAEGLYGERDKSYTILGFEFEKSAPRIWFPGSRKHIIIQLSETALYDEYRAFYQMAHEAIHLLSPLGYSNANILEEGLATYFSDWYLSKLGQCWFPDDQKYKDALVHTKSLLQVDNDIIMKVRKIEPTISYLKPEHFYNINPDISEELLEILCSKF